MRNLNTLFRNYPSPTGAMVGASNIPTGYTVVTTFLDGLGGCSVHISGTDKLNTFESTNAATGYVNGYLDATPQPHKIIVQGA